jgi:hypothetical protein
MGEIQKGKLRIRSGNTDHYVTTFDIRGRYATFVTVFYW